MKILFEDVNDIEEILEEEEDTKLEKAIESSMDCINITGDPKLDKPSKDRMRKSVKNILNVDKVERQVKTRCERVIKNTIIKVLDNFKTGRTFEDLDINFFMTSIEKENLEESIHNAVMEYFTTLGESVIGEATRKKANDKNPRKRKEKETGKDDELREGSEFIQALADINSVIVGRIHQLAKVGERELQIDPYCAAATSNRVAEYLEKHNLCDEKTKKEILKKPYCAIVMAKRSIKEGKKKILGGLGEHFLTEDSVEKFLDNIFGTKNKIPLIHCMD